MKKIMTLSLLFTFNVFSAERVLLTDSKHANVKLDPSTVRCSAFGYGMAELKINIKDLDGWTLFDHSNINSGDRSRVPCMTAGSCKKFDGDKGFSVEDILNGANESEHILIDRQVVEVKVVSKDENGKDVCSRHIEERLSTSVTRGDQSGVINFHHIRSGLFETFPILVCQK
ncbi:MAG: hypothetical protein WC635_16550 [Bacteriovorax sp.]|jgi:hypothetical protein